MEYMMFYIFEYITKIQKKKLSMQDVFFIIKKQSDLDLQFLTKFVESCKTVNIVTNDLERFRKIQDNLYRKENILISVSNNKNKALRKAKYVFNINMVKKEIEKYNIANDAIIINIRENVKYNKKSFNGVNINSLEINLPDEYLEQFKELEEQTDGFDKLKIYEVVLLKKIKQKQAEKVIECENNIENMYFEIADDIIKKDEIAITSLIGNNGKIRYEEFARI